MQLGPFVWGDNGEKLSPDQVSNRRKIAEAMRMRQGFVPGNGMDLLGGLAREAVANFKGDQAERAETAGRETVAQALLDAQATGTADAYMGIIGNEWASPQQTAVAQAMIDRMWGKEDLNDQRAYDAGQLADQRAYDAPYRDAQLQGATLANEAAALELETLRNPPAPAPEYGFTFAPDGTLLRTDTTSGTADRLGSYPKPASEPLVQVVNGDNSSAFNKKADENAAARLDTIIQEGNSASRFLGDIQQLVNLGTQVETGQGTAILAQLGPWAEMAGISIDGLGPAQAYESIISRMAPAMRPAGSGASSDFDARQFLTSLPQLRNSPEGNKLITDTFAAIQQNKMAAAEIASLSMLPADAGGITWQEAEKRIRELPNPYEMFKQVNGGGSDDGAAPAPVAATYAPPPPTVGEVVEGHRFLGGDPADMNSWERVM